MSAREKIRPVAVASTWDDLIGQEADGFDQLAIKEITRRRQSGNAVAVLVLDGERGEFAIRLAQAGASVTVVGVNPAGAALSQTAQALLSADLPLRFVEHEIHRTDGSAPPGAPFDLIICNSSLPYLRYAEALTLLRRLHSWLSIGGKLYVSTLGLHSDLGDAYPDNGKFVQQRFAVLNEAVARRYDINVPVCLYSERDLFLLMFEAGVSVLKSLTTTHGNVKAIGVRV